MDRIGKSNSLPPRHPNPLQNRFDSVAGLT